MKSSFRDRDRPSRSKDLQTTRFQVEPRQDSDMEDGSKEDRELLETDYDTRYGKSFR